MDPAVCSAVASTCSATFRVASVAATPWLTPDAAEAAIYAASCAWRCGIVNPTGETHRARRMPALVSVSDCARRILNAVFGAVGSADASAYPDMPGNTFAPCSTADEAVSSTSAGAFCRPLCLLTVDGAFDACDMLNLQ